MDDLLALARTIATEAGELAVRRRAEGVTVAATKSTILDVVTEADREVERFILGRLQDARPDDGILGEEGTATTGTSGLTWVVDPIDGTVNYLYGVPQYAVSIGLVEGDPDPETWRQQVGVVHNPATGEMFHAIAGRGARLGDREIHINPSTPLDQALIGTGFSYSKEKRAEQGALIGALLPRVRDIRRMGAASLDLCGVACGRLDAYFEALLHPWDHAAGGLIAREAGAVVSGWRDPWPSRDLVFAATPDVAVALRAALDELGMS